MAQFYKSYLKLILIAALIPLFVGAVIFLGITGWMIDFGGSSNTVYWMLFPLCFLGVVAWAIYWLRQRSKQRAYRAAEKTGRDTALQTLGVDNTLQSIITTTLKRRGPLTLEQLSAALDTPKDTLLVTLKDLLSSGTLQQKVTDQDSVFLVNPGL